MVWYIYLKQKFHYKTWAMKILTKNILKNIYRFYYKKSLKNVLKKKNL